MKNRPRDATNKLGNFAPIHRAHRASASEGGVSISIGIGKWDILWADRRFIPGAGNIEMRLAIPFLPKQGLLVITSLTGAVASQSQS